MKHKDNNDIAAEAASEAADEAKTAEAADAQDEAAQDADAAKPGDTINDSETKIRELTEQCGAMNDKYLRLMAEFDNFKRRSASEYERLIESANERLMKDITEVRDNFERGFKSNETGEKYTEGMKLIFSKLNSILHKHGLEVYGEAGEEFNPELHDALMHMAHDDVPEGHIIDVHERGYKLKGKIIKHARVVVSSGKPKTETTDNN